MLFGKYFTLQSTDWLAGGNIIWCAMLHLNFKRFRLHVHSKTHRCSVWQCIKLHASNHMKLKHFPHILSCYGKRISTTELVVLPR